MKEMSVKKIVLSSIAFLASLMALVGLSFKLIGAEAMGIEVSNESGFTQLGFGSEIFTEELEFFKYIFGALGYIILLCSIAGLIVSLVGAFMMKAEKSKSIGLKFSIVYLVFYFVYMICGIVAKVVIENRISEGLSGAFRATELYEISTACFLPFIFALLLLVAHIVCDKVIHADRPLLAGTTEDTQPSSTAAPSVQSTSGSAQKTTTSYIGDIEREREILALLKLYKEALSEDIITQEEYIIKRRYWINLK